MQLYQDNQFPKVEESGFSTVCGIATRYIYNYYRLRADVFRSELRWIGSPTDYIDIDPFDTSAIHFITLSPTENVVAALRLIPAQKTWMMERYFPSLIPEDTNIHTPDACEISRLAIDKEWRNHKVNENIMIAEVLYKGVFQYCLAHQIRYIYMVTTSALVGHLRKKGIPANVLAKQLMPDGVEALIAQLDWYNFIHKNTLENPSRMAWYLNLVDVAGKRMVS